MHHNSRSILRQLAQHWIPLCSCLLLLISIISLRPIDIALTHHSDKLGHLLAYGTLIFPAALRQPRYFIWVFMGFSLWSGIIEVLQNHVGRQGDWLDWLANTVGLIIGTFIALLLSKTFLTKR